MSNSEIIKLGSGWFEANHFCFSKPKLQNIIFLVGNMTQTCNLVVAIMSTFQLFHELLSTSRFFYPFYFNNIYIIFLLQSVTKRLSVERVHWKKRTHEVEPQINKIKLLKLWWWIIKKKKKSTGFIVRLYHISANFVNIFKISWYRQKKSSHFAWIS